MVAFTDLYVASNYAERVRPFNKNFVFLLINFFIFTCYFHNVVSKNATMWKEFVLSIKSFHSFIHKLFHFYALHSLFVVTFILK